MTRSRIELAAGIIIGLAFAALIIHCFGCSTEHYVPVGQRLHPKADCACYASLVVTEDGGMCEAPGALCSRVCTCTQAPLCPKPGRPFVCVADEDGGT